LLALSPKIGDTVKVTKGGKQTMANKGTTIRKAKLYKTARLIPEAWEIPEGFTAGEFVSVSFLYKTWGSCVYQCRSISGNIAAISDLQLDGFVL
jgi:hypothetical protein